MSTPDEMKHNGRPPLVALFGPTAVGKTKVALEVARAGGLEIISADSMQVYRGLAVLTDQPTAEETAAVRHHFIATVPLAEEYSAARYAREARTVIEKMAGRGKTPLMVGGTGLYIRALVGGFSFGGYAAEAERAKWELYLQERGIEGLWMELERRDPEAAGLVDRNNPRRVLRALAAAEGRRSIAGERQRLWTAQSPYRVASFGLESPRELLYSRIDQRVDEIIESGGLEEVRRALEAEVSRTASQAIGFKELTQHLRGELTLDEAAAAIKQKTRRYAKRQLTWMRKMPDIVRIDVAGRAPVEVAHEIIGHLAGAGLINDSG